jgi:glycosyltransferase involved in cell wall biosynthesis
MRHRRNAGHIQTYNDGLAQVDGDYVVLLSADDLLPPGALGRATALMEAHPSVGFVYGFARSFSDEPPPSDPRVRNWSIWRGLDWLAISARKGRCFISSPEVVMRREAIQEAGGYDPRLPHSGDFDMWMRTAVRWDVGRVNGPVQAWYRVHEANMHLTAYAGWLTDLYERRKTFEILFEERAPDRPEVTRLRPQAMRALAQESLRYALAAHRDGADRMEVQRHLAFAVETYPPVRASYLWKLCEVGPLSGRTYPGVEPRRFVSRVRHHVGWRRERRYGT